MNLAIELDPLENNLIVDLIDLNFFKSEKALIIDNDSSSTSDLYALIKKSDSDDIFATLTSDQRIITTYFYLNTYITSEMIVNRWLMEGNLNPKFLSQVYNLIKDSRLLRYEDDSVDQKIISILASINEKASNKPRPSEKAQTVDSISDPVIYFNQLDLAIETMMTHNRVSWCFSDAVNQSDQHAKPSLLKANVSGVKELSVVLTDHDSVITGLTVSYTLFIQVIAYDDLQLIESLCSYFPLGIRDKVTVAYALTNSPILELLLSNYYGKIELHGFNNSGKLSMISSNLSIVEYLRGNGQDHLPYFIRFKRHKTINN